MNRAELLAYCLAKPGAWTGQLALPGRGMINAGPD